MTTEDKALLLKDLCVRLPYGVKVEYNSNGRINAFDVLGIAHDRIIVCLPFASKTECPLIEEVKPYLLPISSMTEEQENEWDNLFIDPLCERVNARHTREEDLLLRGKSGFTSTDYLDKNKFDYRGLIPKGLAIDATNLNIY